MIEREIEAGKVPALAVAVIDSGRVVHLGAAGYRDLDRKEGATIHTPFHIASVSKVVTNLAVFKLVEAKKIDLDADINQYLPFKVRNPFHPRDRITVRELLNHRSGIRDDHGFYTPYWSVPNGDPRMELADFLRDYLSAKGKFYRKEHFESRPDYNSASYSNTGFALLGLIVETVSKTGFEEFCQTHVFSPLSMDNTSWFLRNLDAQEVAKTYTYDDSTGGFRFNGHNGYPDYPAGQLRTSVSDFSKLVLGYLNSEGSKFILSKRTTDQITPEAHISHVGYFTWFLNPMGNNLYYAHGGGDTGVRTVVVMDVTKKRGIVVFANSEYDFVNLLERIEGKMWGR